MDKESKNIGNEEQKETSKHDDLKSRAKIQKTEDLDDTNKYLAMEQQGVKYTQNHNPTANSDDLNLNEQNGSDEWNEEGGNSEYSDAFNQDDYILNDNIDLDEDQNQSISSDDDDFEETNERY